MFRKCVKHEWRSVSRTVIPFFIAMLATSVLLAILPFIDKLLGTINITTDEGAIDPLAIFFPTITGLFTFALISLIIAAGICVTVLSIRRFYTSFFTDEGYLTFTLPVSIDTHILAKLASLTIFTVLGIVIAALSVLVIIGGNLLANNLANNKETVDFWLSFVDVIELIFKEAFAYYPALSAVVILQGIAGFFSEVLLIYFGITLGALITKKHRFIASIGCILGVNSVTSVAQRTVSLIYTFTVGHIGSFEENPDQMILLILITYVLIEVIKILGFYLGTRAILSKKLNLA